MVLFALYNTGRRALRERQRKVLLPDLPLNDLHYSPKGKDMHISLDSDQRLRSTIEN